MNKVFEFYLVDANTLITPYQQYYPFDLFPNFWRFIKNEICKKNIVILDKVYNELVKGGDDLSNWLKNIRELKKIGYANEKIIGKYQKVINYISESEYYNQKALDKWSDNEIADPWLIACASVFNYTIITFESPNSNLKANKSSNPKIPDVCDHFGVKCENLFYMMRNLSFKIE